MNFFFEKLTKTPLSLIRGLKLIEFLVFKIRKHTFLYKHAIPFLCAICKNVNYFWMP